ncbi:hypothetical protein L873DRAFT_1819019 [Choiromyces venosus 120613-1]|uniref:Uncharacterized protein n=1 Tax=Choiromyces venosus 120613-1 TaxID=1336337 RepID=A0A3N4JCS3_9PEZI|nr:hypothetical protein L873DRAFT_1819019 [Choiromyces venosus 120613-1]
MILVDLVLNRRETHYQNFPAHHLPKYSKPYIHQPLLGPVWDIKEALLSCHLNRLQQGQQGS